MKWFIEKTWIKWLALAVAGLSAAYLIKAVAAMRVERERVQTCRAELSRLWKTSVSPTESNVALIEADLEEQRKFFAACLPLLQPTPVTNLNVEEFKVVLKRTLAGLHQSAAVAQVERASTAAFSFESVADVYKLSDAAIPLLAAQLEEIRTLCEALFRARILHLISVRRVAVCEYDKPKGAEFIGGRTEVKAIHVPATLVSGPGSRPLKIEVWPYELTFECQSQALAAVMDEIGSSPQLRIIRTLAVERVISAPIKPPTHRQTSARSGDPPRQPEPRLRVKLRIEIVKPLS